MTGDFLPSMKALRNTSNPRSTLDNNMNYLLSQYPKPLCEIVTYSTLIHEYFSILQFDT